MIERKYLGKTHKIGYNPNSVINLSHNGKGFESRFTFIDNGELKNVDEIKVSDTYLLSFDDRQYIFKPTNITKDIVYGNKLVNENGIGYEVTHEQRGLNKKSLESLIRNHGVHRVLYTIHNFDDIHEYTKYVYYDKLNSTEKIYMTSSKSNNSIGIRLVEDEHGNRNDNFKLELLTDVEIDDMLMHGRFTVKDDL